MDFAKKFTYSAHSFIVIFALLGIIAIINYISLDVFFRIDLTQNKQYTLAESTKNTVAKLDDIVTVKVFFSEKLPPQFLSLSQNVQDMLSEYKAYSNGNLKIEYIDPAGDPKIQNEVRSLGIPEIKMNILEKDKYQIQSGYLGIGIFYADNFQIIPFVKNTENLEYELTAAIKKVTADTLKKIGFLSGHGEHGFNESKIRGETNQSERNDYTLLKKELEKTYDIETIDLQTKPDLKDIATIIIAGPKETLKDYEIFQIDQFLLEGKNILFLIDTVDIGEGLMAKPLDIHINDFLKHFGISVETNLVLDASHESASFSQGFFQFILPYPFWVKAIPQNFEKENPVVSRLESIVFTWISSLHIEKKDNLETNILVKSTEQAGIQSSPFNLDPNQQFHADQMKQYPLAALSRGKFESYFTGKPVPNEEPSNQSENSGTGATLQTPDILDRKDIADKEGSIAIIGDSDFITDSMVNNFPQNIVFIQNIIDFLTLDKDLISIRSKILEDKPLSELSETEKNIAKILGIGLAPILLIAYGIIRTFLRQQKKKQRFESFSLHD